MRAKTFFAMKELLMEMKCIMHSCKRSFWLPVNLPGRDRAGGGGGHWPGGWVCFLLFPKLNWGADGFAVVTPTKEKGKLLLQRDNHRPSVVLGTRGREGGEEGGSSSSHPALVPQQEKPQPFCPYTSSTWGHNPAQTWNSTRLTQQLGEGTYCG